MAPPSYRLHDAELRDAMTAAGVVLGLGIAPPPLPGGIAHQPAAPGVVAVPTKPQIRVTTALIWREDRRSAALDAWLEPGRPVPARRVTTVGPTPE